MIWLWGLGVNAGVGMLALALGWVRPKGFVAGVVAGTVIYAGFDWRGWLLLFGFFVLGSLCTRTGLRHKESLGIAQEKQGARGAKEALANCGVALLLSVAALVTPATFLPLAYAGTFATALADTTASELGPLVGRRTFLPITLKAVPPGTEGAISIEGTVLGALAAFLLALIGWGVSFLPVEALWIVPLAAAFASYLESVIGATHRRGLLANNEVLNALNTAVGAAVAAGVFLLVEGSA